MSEKREKLKLVTIQELCNEFKSVVEEKSNDCFICEWNKCNEEVKICDEHNNIIQNIEDKAEKAYAEKVKENKINKLKRRLNFDV